MRLTLVFLLAFFAFFTAAPPSQAEAQLSAHTAELQLLNLINQQRMRYNRPPLMLDKEASRVCRFHSYEMNESNFFSLDSPGHGSLQYKLDRNNVFGRITRSFIFINHSVQDIFVKLRDHDILVSPNPTHVGIGFHIANSPKYGASTMWLTLTFLEHMASFNKIPRTVKQGQRILIEGQLINGYKSPRLPVTLPNGRVREFRNQARIQKAFQFLFTFDRGPGQYTFELLVDHPREGPKVAAIIPVYADVPFPAPPLVAAKTDESFKTTQDAALHMVKLVNQARAQQKLPALSSDSLLSFVAYQHSQDMGKNDYFAHINPKGEDPTARYRAQGGLGEVGENIAYDISIQSAHTGLMNSPGHRANILKEDYTHVGIGIYHDGKQFYITQLFKTRIPDIDTRQASQNLLRWVNQTRQGRGLPALGHDPVLSRTAEQHSAGMAADNNFSYDSGGLDFYQRFVRNGGRYRELSVNIMIAESINSAIKQLNKNLANILDRQFSYAGIGIYQGNSPDYGENVLWITVGLTSR